MRNQELFNHMSREHGLTLLESEMHEIELIVARTLANDRVQEAARSQEDSVRVQRAGSGTGAALRNACYLANAAAERGDHKAWREAWDEIERLEKLTKTERRNSATK